MPGRFILAADNKPAWQADWDKTVAAARKEGRLNFYVGRYGSEKLLNEFRKEFPEIKIVSTEDVSANEKRVTVEVGESKQRIKYRLLREAESRKWVVDDVHIRQKKGNLVGRGWSGQGKRR